jgi:Mn2+/Fe2+ NRAMP family transporter
MSLPDKSAGAVSTFENPPRTIPGILSRLGPGLIIAGSIVGSGELIATTKTGAESGFWLLWLIIIGCVIKVFVQVELGRDAVCRGKTTMDALAEVPGPSIPGRGNWLVWYWFAMWIAMTAQLGSIAGGVGQSMAMSMPLSEGGKAYNQFMDEKAQLAIDLAVAKRARKSAKTDEARHEAEENVTTIENELQQKIDDQPSKLHPDELYWTALLAVATSIILVLGRYSLIQNVTTTMVAIFTLATVATVFMLQRTFTWKITPGEVLDGLRFQLPPPDHVPTNQSLATALKTFGLIGVGASELIAYPYWCLEKGYARFAGQRDETKGWVERARGWMRVMQWDAWCSMGVYTIATLAFYLLGAAVLGRTGLIPADDDLIPTLNVMYEPVFGAWAKSMFLAGAFAVLYSTFFVASAGNARVFADAIGVMGFAAGDEQSRHKRVVWLSGFFPILSLGLYVLFTELGRQTTWFGGAKVQLVLFSGMMQALMLPMVSAAALYFRYKRCDARILPTKFWDVCLWISSIGMLITAGSLIAVEVMKRLGT